MSSSKNFPIDHFARWILAQKRAKRPRDLFVVGVNGSIGQGKTVFSQALTQTLNTLLEAGEGQAVTRSLDDYYLPRAERYRPEFLARGYNPEGISNRGPAGTHDTERLWRDIVAMEASATSWVPVLAPGKGVVGEKCIELPIFDKPTDDRSEQTLRIYGRVGVFILEGWFVGAGTSVDPAQVPPGLKRSVALALRSYKPIFDRLDALWDFNMPPLDDIIANRIEQQVTMDRHSGRPGMTADQICRFVRYFYEESWEEGFTSPVPPPGRVTFRAKMDAHHQIVKVTPDL